MEIIEETEDLIFKFVIECLDTEEQEQLECEDDIMQKMTTDHEEEIKDRLWYILKQEVNWRNILDRIKKHLE